MKQSLGYGDPQSSLALLVDELCALPDAPAYVRPDALTTDTRVPASAPGSPLVVTRSGDWTDVNVAWGDNRVRIVAWHEVPDTAWDIASWLQARLLAHPGNAAVALIRRDQMPQRGQDPDFDTPIAAFTVLARMRSAIL